MQRALSRIYPITKEAPDMIVAMQVKEVQAHPNADALRIYTFTAPDQTDTQIVANRENVYEVGDVAAVALIGSVLKDGTKIRKARLRGVDSYGMAMGHTQHPVGTDLTEEMGQIIEEAPATPAESPFPAGIEHIKWPSIEHLHHLIANMQRESETMGSDFVPPKVPYRAKIKLDGTNAAIQMHPQGQNFAQSRSRLIHTGEDNIGFAAWVEQHKDYFRDLNERLHQDAPLPGPILVFGEWCGQGIQKRTAISKIGQRIFAIFAVLWGDPDQGAAHLEIEPERLRELIPEHDEIHILPWHHEQLEIDFSSQKSLQDAADTINEWVLSVEERDPWVGEIFGQDGLGEGLVMYPVLNKLDISWRTRWSNLLFKAKGEKHQVVRQKSPVQLSPEHVASVKAFVDLVLTPARLEQGLQEACQGSAMPEKTGDFLRWIAQDIQKENHLEAEASGLEWKEISKPLSQAALQWYKQQLPTL